MVARPRRLSHRHSLAAMTSVSPALWDTLSTRHQAQDIEFLAIKATQGLFAERIHEQLPALGIPSDFALMLDPIPIGGTSARHGDLLATCVVHIDARSGQLRSSAVALPPMPLGGHSTNILRELALQTLRGHVAHLGRRRLRSSLAVVACDGAVVRSGPKHPWVGAADDI